MSVAAPPTGTGRRARPPGARGRGRPPGTSRRELELIALRLFTAQGFEETTIDQIAAGAGVSRRAFFRYFDSKPDVLWGAFDTEVATIRALLDKVPDGLPVMAAVRQAVLAANHYRAADVPELRARMSLIGSVPALMASAAVHYDAWERATAPTRERAVAADAELRRRYPDQVIEPLKTGSSEIEPDPAPASAATSGPNPVVWPDLSLGKGRFGEIAAQLRKISERLDAAALYKARVAQERATEITSMQAEPEEPDGAPLPAWKTDLEALQRDAVRHQPMPRVPHAAAMAAEADRAPEPEAAD